ncbi:hypothetical protein [Aestuariivirga sp.]|uniref:hypothetical protein n=1 Tax=Aestuariivirga sp. TaxID=2650926 RepID=UPI003BABA754
MTDMIIEASVDDDLDRHMIEAALACNLRHLDYISGQLLAFIFTMCGGDDDAPDDDASPSSHRPLPLAEFYAKLYRIGTGWLGWTPADTWHSTPTEIVEAYRGRTELLQAIFGAPGSDDQDGNFKPDLDAKLDRDGLDSLKSLGRL